MKNLTKVQADFILGFLASYRSLSTLKASESQAVGMSKANLQSAISKIRAKRWGTNKSEKRAPSVREFLSKRINEKLSKELKKGFAYRQPNSRWVDIDNVIEVRVIANEKQAINGNWVETPTVSRFIVEEETVRHPKHWNWKANETFHLLTLSPLDTFTTVGGLLTIFKKADRHLAAIPCKWYEQSRGFTITEVQGYLVGDYHIEAENPEKALEIVAKRAKAAKKAAEQRQAIETKADNAILTAKVANKDFGFCMAGIRNFCEINGIDPTKSYTLAEIRNIVLQKRDVNCTQFSSYLQRLGITLNCK